MTFRASDELRSIVLRWVNAMNERDFDTAGNLFLRDDAFRYIGSDAHEWWKGTAPVDSYERRQSEMPEFTMEVEEVEAYESETAGWAALRTTTTFEGLQPRSLRWTKSLEDLLAAIHGTVEDQVRASVRQGTVTLVFTDIEGSTEMAKEEGDERWAEIIASHDATIRQIVERGGGTVVKTLGDGAMIAFDSVRDGARAASQIQRAFADHTGAPALRLRIGMHIGDAVSADGDYLGTAVNKAARVAASARGGQTMASSAVRALLEDDRDFEFAEPQTVVLKGIDGIHEISELLSTPGNDRT